MRKFVFFSLLLVVYHCSIDARKPNPPPNPIFNDCSQCKPELCPQLTEVCKSGQVKDQCDCCTVCGKNEGEPCDVDIVNDDRQTHQKPFYTPHHGRCGNSLQCTLQKDEDSANNVVTDYAVCICQFKNAVCGEDGKTYRNKCHFDETMAGRSERFRIARDEPCDEAPKIMTSSQSAREKSGSDTILSCEVSGYPTPKIEWKFTTEDRQKTITLPSDHTSKSVQVRGGPDHYQVTSWLQITNLQTTDSGVYTCVAKNKLGKITSEIYLTVTGGREL
uniref:Uncharacterized protein n=1 Tax=Romanomermis culicivorax TaxID=13658 RepID=A0A915KCB0_ROMCU